MSVAILGMSHTKVGILKDKTLYDLILESGKAALSDATVSGNDIDAIYIANYGAEDFNNQGHIGPLALDIDPGLRFKPTTRVESACASGSAAILEAVNAIESGRYKTVLVIGAEKMTSLDTAGVTNVLAKASYWPEEGALGYTFPGLYAELAKGYMTHFGFTKEELWDTLAHISVKAHKNALENPLAQLRKEYAFDFARTISDKNPLIAEPLKLSDCSLISDGAAAVVLTTTEKAKSLKDKVVELSSIVSMTDYLGIVNPKRHNWEQEAIRHASVKALQEAGLSLSDINVAEVHDCFTINELLIYEAIGLAEQGKGREILLNGDTLITGKLPVNPSGGLKAKGHPVGATGVSMHVLVAKQLLNEAIGLQVNNAVTGLTINVGGSGATNIVSVLKRIK
jgi:acetyl-CoA C-acetyltransferase